MPISLGLFVVQSYKMYQCYQEPRAFSLNVSVLMFYRTLSTTSRKRGIFVVFSMTRRNIFIFKQDEYFEQNRKFEVITFPLQKTVCKNLFWCAKSSQMKTTKKSLNTTPSSDLWRNRWEKPKSCDLLVFSTQNLFGFQTSFIGTVLLHKILGK